MVKDFAYTAREGQLADLAVLMGLDIASTVVLPTAIEVAAKKVDMTEAQMRSHMWKNEALRMYIRGVCESIAHAENGDAE